jgi:hypothetical protein
MSSEKPWHDRIEAIWPAPMNDFARCYERKYCYENG